MPIQDTSQIKEKILSILRIRGPSLPIHIARGTELTTLFSSAFLSELVSEKKVKMSHMRVGSSPIYLVPGQEYLLENFSQHLKSKEKEAFALLKEKKFLRDSEQTPAIRVALREIKDFAIPLKIHNREELFWRYFTTPESEFKIEIPEKAIAQEQIQKQKKKTEKRKIRKKVKGSQKNDKFFNKIKDFLSKNKIEILDIKEITKNSLILKVKENEKEYLLVAYNKKRVNEQEIIKAYKKALELNLSYKILGLGEPLKKLEELIKAAKSLQNIEKIE